MSLWGLDFRVSQLYHNACLFASLFFIYYSLVIKVLWYDQHAEEMFKMGNDIVERTLADPHDYVSRAKSLFLLNKQSNTDR